MWKLAVDQFQTLLGILRAWRPIAGQRTDEIRPGIGPGSIRDEYGNQLLGLNSVLGYTTFGSEVSHYAREVKAALARSPALANALWLHGRRDRNAADFFMIYEYAEDDLQGADNIVSSLGVTNNEIRTLTASTNNLAPSYGGRHAKTIGKAKWDLDRQKEFISRFLKAWIAYRARNGA